MILSLGNPALTGIQPIPAHTPGYSRLNLHTKWARVGLSRFAQAALEIPFGEFSHAAHMRSTVIILAVGNHMNCGAVVMVCGG